MAEFNGKEEQMGDPIVAEEFKIGICEGEPEDGFVLVFKGKRMNSTTEDECAAIIPMQGMPEVIQGLFSVGVEYQKETGIDIGFSSVIGEEDE